VQFSDVRDLIQSSQPGDWNGIHCWGSGSGPTYRMGWDKGKRGDDWELYFRQHSHVAAFKPDLSLTLAWGMEAHFDMKREMTPDWIENFPLVDGVSYYLLDTFWNGALVDRGYYAPVDAEAYVPLPSPVYGRDDDEGVPTLERYEVTRYDVALTRIVNVLANHRADDFDRVLSRTGFVIVDELSD
jgi:hypothetical protein